MLSISFRRVSPTHHEFSYRRKDGSGETIQNETKSTLFHDLLHFAVESEAGLKRSFYGLIEGGRTYAELSDTEIATKELTSKTEIATTERVVGTLSSLTRGPASPQAILEGLQNWLGASGEELPPWLTETMVHRIERRFRQLEGAWRATPFGESLELCFNPEGGSQGRSSTGV